MSTKFMEHVANHAGLRGTIFPGDSSAASDFEKPGLIFLGKDHTSTGVETADANSRRNAKKANFRAAIEMKLRRMNPDSKTILSASETCLRENRVTGRLKDWKVHEPKREKKSRATPCNLPVRPIKCREVLKLGQTPRDGGLP